MFLIQEIGIQQGKHPSMWFVTGLCRMNSLIVPLNGTHTIDEDTSWASKKGNTVTQFLTPRRPRPRDAGKGG